MGRCRSIYGRRRLCPCRGEAVSPGATLSDSCQRVESIRTALQALEPSTLLVIDESHKHAGHAGARSGGGHFNLTIVSNVFDGKGLLQRHRMVYDALGSAMQTDIHALTIKALTPEELPI